MLFRLPVALFHLVLALAGWLGFGLFAGQTALNATWERGFYGAVSMASWTIGAEAAIGFLFSTVQAAAAVAFVRGGRASGHAIVLVSMVLAWTAQWPLNLVLGLAGLAGVAEVWRHLPEPEPAEEEEED